MTRLTIFTTLLTLFTWAGLEAKHIIGGVITYECLGETSPGVNQYLFTMKIYRDCDPAAGGAYFDVPAHFSVFRGNLSAASMVSTFDVYDVNITELPIDTPSCIQNVPYVCVQEGVYTFTQELPILQNESYLIVYQRCCRNNSIVNMIDPEDIGATYLTELTPRAQQACNNSPVYTNFPPPIICKDVPLVFDHSATDQDGDLLVYSFCSPLQGGGPILTDPGYSSCEGAQPTPPCGPPFLNVPFASPYSPGNPMGGEPQITVNPVTGEITGIPEVIGRFVVGVCVDEYRNGVLLSSTRREFQFNVADCDPTVLARIDGGDTLILTPVGYYLSTCGEKELYIQNKSLDQNYIDNFEWHFDLMGTPYFNNSIWSPTIEFPEAGRYFGSLYLNPGQDCADTAEIIVDIYPEVEADFTYAYDTCIAGPVQFTDLSTGEGGLIEWNWQFGVPNGVDTLQHPSFDYLTPGIHPVRLRVTDQNGCYASIIKNVNYFPAPAIIIIKPNSFVGCAPGDIYFNNLSYPIDSTYFIAWDFGDGGRDTGIISPTHTYTQPGIYDVSLTITSPIGCSISDTFPELIRVVPAPVADFSYSPEQVSILNPTVQFTDLSIDVDRWNWQFGHGDFSLQQNPSYTFMDTGWQKITLIVTHPEGCKDSITRYIDVIPEIRWFMPNAFSPNNDGDNEGFLGKGYMEGVTGFNMTIWNRWGELVFETDDYMDSWNGRARNTGGNSPEGVYVYRVQFVGPRGEKFDLKGFATLLR